MDYIVATAIVHSVRKRVRVPDFQVTAASDNEALTAALATTIASGYSVSSARVVQAGLISVEVQPKT